MEALAKAPDNAKAVILAPCEIASDDFESICCVAIKVDIEKAVNVGDIGICDLSNTYYREADKEELIKDIADYLECCNIKDKTPEQWIEENLEWEDVVFVSCEYDS